MTKRRGVIFHHGKLTREEWVSYIIKAVTSLGIITLHARQRGSKNIFRSFALQTGPLTLISGFFLSIPFLNFFQYSTLMHAVGSFHP